MPTFFIWTAPEQFPAALFAIVSCSWAFIAEAIYHTGYVIVLGFKVVAAFLVNAEDVSHFISYKGSLDKRSLPAIYSRWSTRADGFSALLRFAMHPAYDGAGMISMALCGNVSAYGGAVLRI